MARTEEEQLLVILHLDGLQGLQSPELCSVKERGADLVMEEVVFVFPGQARHLRVETATSSTFL